MAISRPIPRAAPVTSTTLPLSIMSRSLRRGVESGGHDSTAARRSPGLGGLPLDTVLLELAPQCGAADPERLGGARVVAPEALQGLENVDALGLRQRHLLG